MSLFNPEDSMEAGTTAALLMAWPWEPVTFKDVAVTFSPEQWASLESRQKSLYRKVMLDNYALVAAIAAVPPCKPALITWLERGEALWNSESSGSSLPGPGSWIGKEELDLEPEADAEKPGAQPGSAPRSMGSVGQAAGANPNLVLYRGMKFYRCRDCGKIFQYNSALLRHQMSHNREKPFPCGECGKASAQKVATTQHQRLHSTERPSGAHGQGPQGPALRLVPVVPQGSPPALAVASSPLAFAHSLLLPASGPVLLLLPASGSPEPPRALLPPVQILHVFQGLSVPAKGAPLLLPTPPQC